ncbi:exodeoxyribonuclease III [Thermomonas sp.]|jgi:exodeoxyribonuclease-3|uniref:exodeoxyribonuclease III n=1 Tax=Thermomonas sp. TaxID=1971895 RepID=UPI001B5326F2|nr:exodeoxyribonuclease III [Thermomonas sp.]HQX25711.1 exodeoxyribonuclease III [Pseudomonadota bacterium]MBK6333392.1 exodeoxyribonuclease III [Thermomonas sp.]MBK6415417.1 exodeoxyribonuclease III [Thermomonas sp.]MBK9670580.1 exodeoxyribonuclease III [Thermomonas sp.]MBL0228525.1 exodeoxyribonuclease III [Thermomonas sp.]
MKIASWNVNSLNVRLPHLQRWLDEAKPDVVALQETKQEDHKFPEDALLELGYRSVFSGQKTYNGVAIISRLPFTGECVNAIPGFDDPQKRVLAATVGDARIVDLYVVNGEAVGSGKFDYKLRWLAAVREWLRAEIAAHPNLVVLGDFNIAPDDRDVFDPRRWREKVLCSSPEREAYRALLELGLHDSFRLFNDEAGHHSWWDYRLSGFERGWGLRIDLVLVSEALKARCVAAGIDREPRSWERPSDHTPVWVEIGP